MSVFMLILLVGGALLGVLLIFALGATLYEFANQRRAKLDEQDHTRSYDWTSDQ